MKATFTVLLCLFFKLGFANEIHSNNTEEAIDTTVLEKSLWPWSKPQQKWEIKDVLGLEDILCHQILGQERAIRKTLNALICQQAGIQNADKPLGAFLYIGPTGVGKTLLAKKLAEIILKDANQFIRLDMAEYASEIGGIWRLIGSPPGYVDSGNGGQLSNAILKNPCSVILLDEIEKASSDVRNLFLRIFDEGYFTTSRGTLVDCRQCLFIATTNIGAATILNRQAEHDYEEVQKLVEPELMSRLTPELYNRLEPIVFLGISPDILDDLVKLELSYLSKRVLESKQVHLEFDESTIDYLKRYGYNYQLGARALEKLIKHEVTSFIARILITNNYKKGDHMYVTYDGSQFIAVQGNSSTN